MKNSVNTARMRERATMGMMYSFTTANLMPMRVLSSRNSIIHPVRRVMESPSMRWTMPSLRIAKRTSIPDSMLMKKNSPHMVPPMLEGTRVATASTA